MKGKTATIIYTAIITTLVIAIVALVYREFFWHTASEQILRLKAQQRSVQWLIYANDIKLKKIKKTETIDIDFAEKQARYYGLDVAKNIEKIKGEIKEAKDELEEDNADLKEDLAELEQDIQELEAMNKK